MASIATWGGQVLVQSKAHTGETIGLADGRFVTLYSRNDSRGISDSFAQYYNADGTKAGAAIRLHQTSLPEDGPKGLALPDGGFVAAWTAHHKFVDNAYVQRFDVKGHAVGDLLLVADDDHDQTVTSMTALAGGGIAVACDDYVHNYEYGDDAFPRLQLFDQYMEPVGPAIGISPQMSFVSDSFDENFDYQRGYDTEIIALQNGNFVAAWTNNAAHHGDDPDIYDDTTLNINVLYQLFGPDGAALGPEAWIEAPSDTYRSAPTGAALQNGGFVIAYSESGEGLSVRLFGADGSETGEPIRVAAAKYADNPTVEALHDGRILVAWLDKGDNLKRTEIRATILNADGSLSVDEVKVVTTKGKYGPPEITELADGRVVFTWNEISNGSKGGVHQQIFDPRLGPVDLDGTRLADQLIGTKWGDVIRGLGSGDILDGAKGADTLIGGGGRDTLIGGAGADHFVFAARSESRPYPFRDAIMDFHVKGNAEVIDLSALSPDDLVWRGTSGFTYNSGEVRYKFDGPNKTIVQINLDYDSAAEMEITLVGHMKLSAGDFIL